MSPAEANPYTVLGVPDDATIDQIRKAYRRKARATHPDHGGSATDFHEVTRAYRLLTDTAERQAYQRRSDAGTHAPASSSKSSPKSARRSTPSTDGGSSRAETREFGATPVFRPPFGPDSPPVVPLATAGQQSHSSPRKPGMLRRLSPAGPERYDAELRTVQLLQGTLLPDYPAGRLVNGVRFQDGTEAGSVLLGGYRIAVIESRLASASAYRWDGTRLLHKGREEGGPGLRNTVRAVQERFPGCHVSGWLVLHDLRGNPFEPVIDYPPGADRSSFAPVHAVNAGTLTRQLRRFMSAGPQPDVVQLPVLARLLEAT